MCSYWRVDLPKKKNWQLRYERLFSNVSQWEKLFLGPLEVIIIQFGH